MPSSKTSEPEEAVVHNDAGVIQAGRGQREEAERSFRQALALRADYFEAQYNLAVLQLELGRWDEAERSCSQALALRPDYFEAHNNLGAMLRELGRADQAERILRRAVELRPEIAEVHGNLALALSDLERLEEAEQCLRRALALKPALADAHFSLANVLRGLGRPEESVQCLRSALELDPGFAAAHSSLIFTLDLIARSSVEEQQEERRRWNAQHGHAHTRAAHPHENDRDPERKLRIGYVSADFFRHSASFIFGPVIRRHDRRSFELLCYSGVKHEDEVTAGLREAAGAWRSTLDVPDDALAEQIRRDKIDILVDLSGHSAGNRLPLFARRPAPVQVTAWGLSTGTGLEAMDYFLADGMLVPTDERGLYAEEVVDLPCCVCYEPPAYLPAVSPLPALAGKPFTFGCVNRIEKVSDKAIGLWARILAELPTSQLLVKDRRLSDAGQRRGFLRRLGAAGIAEGRVRLAGRSLHYEHLQTFQEVDFGLDPYPHGGGVSTLEALWMGVPVVTLQGRTPASRLSASILTAMGMPEWIARSEDDYVRIAVAAARNPGKLQLIREEMRERCAQSVVGHAERYTHAVEQSYRRMWRNWCAGA